VLSSFFLFINCQTPASEKNDSPGKVQLLIKIPEIEEIEDVGLLDLEATKEHKSVFEKIIDLFNLMLSKVVKK